MLLKLVGLKYATSLDLNVGCYHIKLWPFPRKVCTIVLPCERDEYQKLTIELCNIPDKFQEKMNKYFNGLDHTLTAS